MAEAPKKSRFGDDDPAAIRFSQEIEEEFWPDAVESGAPPSTIRSVVEETKEVRDE